MSKRTGNPLSLGFLQALTLLFIGLKLTDYIDWPWPLVLLPIILPIVIILGIGVCWLIGLITLGIVEAVSKKINTKFRR